MSRILTLDNMDDVSLQGTYEYREVEPYWSYLIRQERTINQKKEYITLGDVYRLFEQGLKFHEVKEALFIGDSQFDRDVENKTVLIGQVFYNAVNPGVSGFNRNNLAKALCDENLDEHNVVDGAQRAFGYATHTSYEGLTSEPDTVVFKTAVEGKFDFIISKDRAQKPDRISYEDRDLTNCAYDAWRDVFVQNGGVVDEKIRSLPLIIHIKDAQADGRAIKKMLRKYADDILDVAQKRESPVIILEKGRKPYRGEHYLELIDGGSEKKARMLIEKQYALYMRLNPLRLSREEKVAVGERIESAIRKEVDTIVSQYSSRKYVQSEVLIPLLDERIKKSDGDSIDGLVLSAQNQRSISDSVQAELAQIEKTEKQKGRRSALKATRNRERFFAMQRQGVSLSLT